VLDVVGKVRNGPFPAISDWTSEPQEACVGVMDEFERDGISKRFANLTALLEDAAGLAVEGQSRQRSLALIRKNIAHIWPLLIACVAQLALLERHVQNQETNRSG